METCNMCIWWLERSTMQSSVTLMNIQCDIDIQNDNEHAQIIKCDMHEYKMWWTSKINVTWIFNVTTINIHYQMWHAGQYLTCWRRVILLCGKVNVWLPPQALDVAYKSLAEPSADIGGPPWLTIYNDIISSTIQQVQSYYSNCFHIPYILNLSFSQLNHLHSTLLLELVKKHKVFHHVFLFPILKTLHWTTINQSFQYKIISLIYTTISLNNQSMSISTSSCLTN